MTQLGVSGDYRVRFHSATGAIRNDFPCGKMLTLGWARQLSEQSRATLAGGTASSYDLIKNVQPWTDMLSIWRGEDFVWTGFVTGIKYTKTGWAMGAFDPSCLMWRTRTPISKKWTDTDPVTIASELFDNTFNFQGIQGITGVSATVPSATSYTFSVSKDSKMVHQNIEDLVKMGIHWTVVGGKPLVMPALRSSQLTFSKFALADCDFATELEAALDGTRFANDVRLKGGNWAETVVTTDTTGLRIQQIVSIDKLVGVTNIQRAARQQAARSSVLRKVVSVPSGAALIPTVNIGINELIPGIVVPVHTDLLGGITDWQRLESVEVKVQNGNETVGVTLATSATELEGGD